MKKTLDDMLTQVYELEGLLLVMQRHGDEVPKLVVERLKEAAEQFVQQARLLQVEDLKNVVKPVAEVEYCKPTEEPENAVEPIKPVEQQKLSSVAPTIEKPKESTQPASHDITSAFSINDRFLFKRELFDDDQQRFDDTIALMQKMRDIDQIQLFMTDELGWNTSDEVVKEFVRLIDLGLKQ